MSLQDEWRGRIFPGCDEEYAVALERCADDLDAHLSACGAREGAPGPEDYREPGVVFVAWFRWRPGARLVAGEEMERGIDVRAFSRWQKFTLTEGGLVPAEWSR